MPGGPTDQVPLLFFDLYSRGEFSAEAIDDWVGRWHDCQDPASLGRELFDYLGLTVPEYPVWVCDADALSYVLKAGLGGPSLAEVVGNISPP
jgi:hypothetical protein